MIIYTLNDTRYELKNDWQDITLQEAMQLRDIEIPEQVDDVFDLYQNLDSVKAAIKVLTNAPVDLIPPTWVVSWFVRFAFDKMLDLRSNEVPRTYAPQMIEEFKHKGKTYYMPSNLDLGYDVILQHGQNAKSMVEASNLLKLYSEMKQDGIKVMPSFVASVVKEDRDEQFNELQIIQRAESFKDLRMHHVWEVFFCTLQLLHKQQIDTLRSLIKEKQKPQSVEERLASRLGRLQLRKVVLQERLKKLIG